MSTKSDLEDEVARLNAVVAEREKAYADLSKANLDLNYQVNDLKRSNQYLATVADRYRGDLEATQLRHVQDILGLTQKAMNAMEEIAVKADLRLAHEIAVERARTDTLSQCFDRALQTAAGNVGE